MSSFPLRELRVEDAEEVAALFRAAFGGVRPIDAEEIRTWLANDDLKPEWIRVLELDGRVVGYGDIYPGERDLALDAAAPGHWSVYFDWAEAEARARRLPEVRTWFADGHDLEHDVAARGYSLQRASFQMEIALDDPMRPQAPDGLALARYLDADAAQLRAALNEAFALDPTWQQVTPETFGGGFYLQSRGFDPGLWTLAWDDGELAGFSLAYRGRGSDDTLGWVGTLGVRAPWRRRGLGEALLRASFRELWERGFRRAGLGVDAENVTGAVRLYERAGMHQVQRSNTWSKRL
jgi:ribosomal protein S18 acetylase RimI-like enzyme